MSAAVILQGTLKPDGTLELDEKPNLPAGRVQVLVQPLPATPPVRRGLVEVMDEIRRDQDARGYQRRTLEEMEVEEAARREEEDAYDSRCEDLWGTKLPPAKDKE
jgi:hypothetical protein